MQYVSQLPKYESLCRNRHETVMLHISDCRNTACTAYFQASGQTHAGTTMKAESDKTAPSST